MSVEVDELVERLIRCAHVLREDGDRQQGSREVITTVSEGTQHGRSKLVGPVGSHVQEEAGRKRQRARSQKRIIKKEGQKIRCSLRKVRKKGLCVAEVISK